MDKPIPEAVLATLAALDRDALDAANQRAAWTDQDAARAANEESFKARKALRALTAAQQPVQEGGGVCPKCRGTGEVCTGYIDGTPEMFDCTCPAAAPPSAPVGLDPPVERQRDLLAQAIRDAAVKAGIARADADMTGPMLLMLCDDMADCILTQQPAQAAPGWKLVPVEPTDGMLTAYYEADRRRAPCTSGWRAMLAAAPTPPGDDAAGGGHG